MVDEDVVDLGNGVHEIAATKGSLRLEIIPPAITYNVSTWNGAYSSIQLPGYSNTVDAGLPELVERTMLVEVDPSNSTATVTNAAVTEAGIVNHQIEPAPSYAVNGSGQLIPSWSPDATAYSTNAYAPSAFYTLNPTLQQIAGKTYLSLKVTPVLYFIL